MEKSPTLPMDAPDKIIVVTRKTPLEELIERFNSRAQAKFYIEHSGAQFQDYEEEHDAYHRSLDVLKRSLPRHPPSQWIERSFLPTFQFGTRDLIVTIGQDGLVVNVAKYLTTQPILAFNPDPSRIDGVLIPFPVPVAKRLLPRVLEGRVKLKRISMAEAELNDGQTLIGVNDLFIGPRSHISAKYVLQVGQHREPQSSSGIIISTGTGSTGWLQSIITGSAAVTKTVVKASFKMPTPERYRLDGESDELYFAVREPFTSRTSKATLVFGRIGPGDYLYVTSQMPGYGVIFSDGIEHDFVAFNSGAIAKIGVASRKAHLITDIASPVSVSGV